MHDGSLHVSSIGPCYFALLMIMCICQAFPYKIKTKDLPSRQRKKTKKKNTTNWTADRVSFLLPRPITCLHLTTISHIDWLQVLLRNIHESPMSSSSWPAAFQVKRQHPPPQYFHHPSSDRVRTISVGHLWLYLQNTLCRSDGPQPWSLSRGGSTFPHLLPSSSACRHSATHHLSFHCRCAFVVFGSLNRFH